MQKFYFKLLKFGFSRNDIYKGHILKNYSAIIASICNRKINHKGIYKVVNML